MDIISLVGNYAFPVVACIAMAAYLSKMNQNYREDINALNENHKNEYKEMINAINNNTQIMRELVDLIKKEDK